MVLPKLRTFLTQMQATFLVQMVLAKLHTFLAQMLATFLVQMVLSKLHTFLAQMPARFLSPKLPQYFPFVRRLPWKATVMSDMGKVLEAQKLP
jgi:hypothetical protein